MNKVMCNCKTNSYVDLLVQQYLHWGGILRFLTLPIHMSANVSNLFKKDFLSLIFCVALMWDQTRCSPNFLILASKICWNIAMKKSFLTCQFGANIWANLGPTPSWTIRLVCAHSRCSYFSMTIQLSETIHLPTWCSWVADKPARVVAI